MTDCEEVTLSSRSPLNYVASTSGRVSSLLPIGLKLNLAAARYALQIAGLNE